MQGNRTPSLAFILCRCPSPYSALFLQLLVHCWIYVAPSSLHLVFAHDSKGLWEAINETIIYCILWQQRSTTSSSPPYSLPTEDLGWNSAGGEEGHVWVLGLYRRPDHCHCNKLQKAPHNKHLWHACLSCSCVTQSHCSPYTLCYIIHDNSGRHYGHHYCLFAFTWALEVAVVYSLTQVRVIITTSLIFVGNGMRRHLGVVWAMYTRETPSRCAFYPCAAFAGG